MLHAAVYLPALSGTPRFDRRACQTLAPRPCLAPAARLYCRAASQGDGATLSTLRAQIEDRIDALEAFYMANRDDERAALFNKQCLKLRKLLHDPTSALAGSPGAGARARTRASPGSPGSRAGGASAGRYAGSPEQQRALGTSRSIAPGTRLTLDELLGWLASGADKTMSHVPPDVAEAVYFELAKYQADEKISLRDFKSWYFSFGRYDATLDDLFPSKNRGARTATTRDEQILQAAAALGPLYDWERGETGNEDPVGLPGKVVEFRITLTEEEFNAYQLAKRSREAEERYKARRAKARQKHSKLNRSRRIGATSDAVSVASSKAPYKDPKDMRELFMRSSDSARWVADKDFQS